MKLTTVFIDGNLCLLNILTGKNKQSQGVNPEYQSIPLKILDPKSHRLHLFVILLLLRVAEDLQRAHQEPVLPSRRVRPVT